MMDWLAQNWIWVLFAAAFFAMHLFGHGAHGGHGRSDRHAGHGGGCCGEGAERDSSEPEDQSRSAREH